MEGMVVGIDVSKDRFDVAVRPTGEGLVLKRTAAGILDLVAWLKTLSPVLVAIEATGASKQWWPRAWLVLVFPLWSSIRRKCVPSRWLSANEPRPIRSTRRSSRISPRQPNRSFGNCLMR